MDSFLTNFVQRECGLVTYYEAWNEPNLGDYWQGTNAQLLTVAQHFNAIVKEPANCGCSDGVCSPGGGKNPNRVLTPSVNSICLDSGRQWLTDWLALVDSSGLRSDVVSFHGYDCQPENIGQNITWLRSLADAHGLGNAEIWDTEASWGKEQGSAEELEASWLMRSYVVQAASGVARFYWYAYGSCSWGSLYGPSCGSSPDNRQGMREAGIAYGTVSKWLRGATIETCTSDEQQTWSCILTRPNGYAGCHHMEPQFIDTGPGTSPKSCAVPQLAGHSKSACGNRYRVSYADLVGKRKYAVKTSGRTCSCRAQSTPG